MQIVILCLITFVLVEVCYLFSRTKYTKKINIFASSVGVAVVLHLIVTLAYLLVYKACGYQFELEILGRCYMATSVMIVMSILFYYIKKIIPEGYKRPETKAVRIISLLMVFHALTSKTYIFPSPAKESIIIAGSGYRVAIIYSLFVSLIALFAIITSLKKLTLREKHAYLLGYIIMVGSLIIQIITNDAIWSICGYTLFALELFISIENADIKYIKIAEEERDIAEKSNKSKSMFVSNVSHEIRTPMNVICGMTEILEDTNLSNEQRKYIENIKHSSQNLLSIINDILDVSQMEAGKFKIVEEDYSFSTMLDDLNLMIVERLKDKPVKFAIKPEGYVPEFLKGDKKRVQQVFLNILNNAAKYTDKGEIILSISTTSIGAGSCMLYVSVSDTGCGIRESDLDKLFTTFGRVETVENLNKEGTGLGLCLCRELVKSMGGTIDVESTYGKGSVFKFSLKQKLADKKKTDDKEIASLDKSREIRFDDTKVLVIDDNALNLTVVEGFLKGTGAQVDTVQSGARAIEVCQAIGYDIIFCDRMMPEMSGEETVTALKKITDCPIIALTADLSDEARKEMLGAGAVDFFVKPVERNSLFKIMGKNLPSKKVHYVNEASPSALIIKDTKEHVLDNPLVDEVQGIKNCSTLEIYKDILRNFNIPSRETIDYIKGCIKNGNVQNYSIKVHALKSSFRSIGALETAGKFEELEMLSKTWGIFSGEILSLTDTAFKEAEDIMASIDRVFSKDKAVESEELLSPERLKTVLKAIYDALNVGDLEKADKLVKSVKREDVKKAVLLIDIQKIKEIMETL